MHFSNLKIESMKKSSKYTDKAITALLEKYGGFFAFGDQFKEKAKPGVKYCHLFAGLCCPKENARALLEGIERACDDGIKLDLEENGPDKIIERELHNHECFYTWDLDQVIEYLEPYGISADQVKAKFEELIKEQ